MEPTTTISLILCLRHWGQDNCCWFNDDYWLLQLWPANIAATKKNTPKGINAQCCCWWRYLNVYVGQGTKTTTRKALKALNNYVFFSLFDYSPNLHRGNFWLWLYVNFNNETWLFLVFFNIFWVIMNLWGYSYSSHQHHVYIQIWSGVGCFCLLL